MENEERKEEQLIPQVQQEVINEVLAQISTPQQQSDNPIPYIPTSARELLMHLLNKIPRVDFRTLVELDDNEDIRQKHLIVCCIAVILKTAIENSWALCKRGGFLYVFNSRYWILLEREDVEWFLGEAPEKMGVNKTDAKLYTFKEQLFKQFLSQAHLPRTELSPDVVLVGLQNGTFEISPMQRRLRAPKAEDFLTYQLSFNYDPEAKCPLFDSYLNRVLPDSTLQMIVAEFVGYIFIRTSHLKLEKVLVLYGSGANGKSVFYEIITALLGGERNVSSYSLENLTNTAGYFRAMLVNKLVNYASEINGRLEASIFKQLASGEPVEARLPYGQPFIIRDYAKLIFNCNELPKSVELTHAFFRRFVIIPFEITIPDAEQDKDLYKKIVESELSGIFNWVLAGLDRLLVQRQLTQSEVVSRQVEQYKKESDSVLMFLEDEVYRPDAEEYKTLKELFEEYKEYTRNNGYPFTSIKKFSERLRKTGITVHRRNQGNIVFIKKY